MPIANRISDPHSRKLIPIATFPAFRYRPHFCRLVSHIGHGAAACNLQLANLQRLSNQGKSKQRGSPGLISRPMWIFQRELSAFCGIMMQIGQGQMMMAEMPAMMQLQLQKLQAVTAIVRPKAGQATRRPGDQAASVLPPPHNKDWKWAPLLC